MFAWVLLLSLALSALAKPIYDVRGFGFLTTDQRQIFEDSSGAYLAASCNENGDGSSRIAASVPGSEAVLMRRSNIKLIIYKTHEFIYPVYPASGYIMEFFNAVAVESMIHWSRFHRPPALFTVTQGQFQLTISCMGGTVP